MYSVENLFTLYNLHGWVHELLLYACYIFNKYILCILVDVNVLNDMKAREVYTCTYTNMYVQYSCKVQRLEDVILPNTRCPMSYLFY